MDFHWIENNILHHLLNEAEQKLFNTVFDIVEFNVGDDVIAQNSREKAIFIIRSGMASISYSYRSVNTHVGFIDSGAVVGEMGFFRGQSAAATVSAMSSIQAYKLTRQAYCKLLGCNQTMVINLLTYMQTHTSQALDKSNQQLASILMSIKKS